jgi:transmembrane sensor
MTDGERLGPPPVEPMSDVAWSRLERGLWLRVDAAEATARAAGSSGTAGTDRISPAFRRWWPVAAPLVAAAAVVAIVLGTRATPQDVAVTDGPARVVSGSSPSSVSFSDSHVELNADTVVVMNHENGHPVVLLERGSARFTVAPRGQRPEFIVRAGDATVRVVGTRFRVSRSDERIAVDVERGLVNVQFRGSMVAIGENQRWSSDSPGHITALASRPSPAHSVAASEPSIDPTIDQSADPPIDSPVDSPATSEPLKAPSATKHHIRPNPNPNTVPDPRRGGTHATSADRDRIEYDRLAALEPKHPDAALAGYLALARGTSRWADPALFAAARLAVDRHDPRARTLLGIYLERFPTGPNATDAKQLLVRLQGDHP